MKVAVAGATGTVGLHIVREISRQNKHQVIALARSPNDELKSLPNVTFIAVDYNNEEQLTSALQGCTTVISTIFNRNDMQSSLGDVQRHLINAAQKAGIKRFAPSEFAILPEANQVTQHWKVKSDIASELAQKGFEYILFMQGIFMNYFCSGSPHNEQKGLDGFNAMPFLLDIPNSKATIPGDGNTPFATTLVSDVAKFVTEALDLEKWDDPRMGGMSGSIQTYNELVDIAGRVTGRKMERIYLSVEKLEAMAKSDDAGLAFRGSAMLAHAKGFANTGTKLNELCPQVRPTSVEEFLREYWE